jgi:hypothetical protein
MRSFLQMRSHVRAFGGWECFVSAQNSRHWIWLGGGAPFQPAALEFVLCVIWVRICSSSSWWWGVRHPMSGDSRGKTGEGARAQAGVVPGALSIFQLTTEPVDRTKLRETHAEARAQK